MSLRTKERTITRFHFPRWVDSLKPLLGGGAVFGGLYAVVVLTFGFAPTATDVGYMPRQPIPYSHALHAGELGMDCRYCHTTVEHTAHAWVPPTQTCLGCHTNIHPNKSTDTANPDPKDKLNNLLVAATSGNPVPWVRIHDLPDYSYFNHSAHVTRGIGCASCHGRVDRMEEVWQQERLSMSWCLKCHRNPEEHLRPLDKITDMEWRLPRDEQLALGAKLREENKINPSTDCSTCHR
ncbi:MAG: cytochrome c3 family protein [Phycisphaerae bacterium]|nr:cytochrome c3 family protein [Phycisphaerae bacterium]